MRDSFFAWTQTPIDRLWRQLNDCDTLDDAISMAHHLTRSSRDHSIQTKQRERFELETKPLVPLYNGFTTFEDTFDDSFDPPVRRPWTYGIDVADWGRTQAAMVGFRTRVRGGNTVIWSKDREIRENLSDQEIHYETGPIIITTRVLCTDSVKRHPISSTTKHFPGRICSI